MSDLAIQGQTMTIQRKSAYILLIIGCTGLHCSVNLQDTISCESFGGVRFDLKPLLHGQTMAAQHLSAYM